MARCPKCGSTDVETHRKGFSAGKATAGCCLTGGVGLLFGAHGASQLMLTCLECGYTWKPGAGKSRSAMKHSPQRRKRIQGPPHRKRPPRRLAEDDEDDFDE